MAMREDSLAPISGKLIGRRGNAKHRSPPLPNLLLRIWRASSWPGPYKARKGLIRSLSYRLLRGP